MAFYDDSEDEEGQEIGGGQQTGPQSSTISAAPGGSGNAPKAAGSPDKGGNFVGIQQYLNANKPQAQKLGDQAAGVINQSAEQARQGIGALNQEASEKIKPTQSLDSGIAEKLAGGAETLSGDERSTVKNTANATYQGPRAATDLAGYQAASDAQKKATSNIDNSGTEQGRMGLISQINSKPRTQGMNVFDNALLSAGGGREKLTQAAAANQDVKGGVEKASEAIGSQIGRADDPSTPDVDESAGAIGQTNKAKADAMARVQEALNTWQTGFQPKVQAAQDAFVANQNKYRDDIGDEAIFDQETLDLFGLGEGAQLYDMDLASYLQDASPGSINAGNVADQTDYARYAALAEMAGIDPTILNPANASMAGSAPTFGIDNNRFKNDYAAKKAAYDKAYTQDKLGDYAKPLEQLFAGDIMRNYTAQQLADGLRSEDGSTVTPEGQRAYDLKKQVLDDWMAKNYGTRVARTSPETVDWGDVGAPGAPPVTGGIGKGDGSPGYEELIPKKKGG